MNSMTSTSPCQRYGKVNYIEKGIIAATSTSWYVYYIQLPWISSKFFLCIDYSHFQNTWNLEKNNKQSDFAWTGRDPPISPQRRIRSPSVEHHLLQKICPLSCTVQFVVPKLRSWVHFTLCLRYNSTDNRACVHRYHRKKIRPQLPDAQYISNTRDTLVQVRICWNP
jgi:hypothetical protein